MKRLSALASVLFLLCSITLCAIPPAVALEWSELLPNPPSTDDGKEFIELLGNESLEDCTIKDKTSADRLVLARPGSDTILVLENESEILPRATEANATIYVIGSAIGNGLDNTYDTLTIACGEQVMLNTSYNTSAVPGFKEGLSLVWDGAWRLGTANGTPGAPESTENHSSNQTNESVPATPSPDETKPTAAARGRRGGGGCPPIMITASRTSVEAGEPVTISIISSEYAWFEALADNKTILEGDTLQGRERTLTAPAAERLRIVAHSSACGGMRTSKTITILPPPTPPSEGEETTAPPEHTLPVEGTTALTQDVTEEVAVPLGASESPQEASGTAPDRAAARFEADATADAPAITGAVIVDTDRQVVPWIAGFGIITLLVSAAVFLRVHKGEP